MLPLIIFSAVIVYLNYEANRKNAADRVLEVTRGMMLAVDRELQGIVAALQVLALSRPYVTATSPACGQAETYLYQQHRDPTWFCRTGRGRSSICASRRAHAP